MPFNPEVSLMRPHVVRTALVLTLLSGAIVAAQEGLPPPQVPGRANLLDHLDQREQYFARIGKGKGTGYRQYARQVEFMMPRSYPSGDAVNFTARTFAHHFRAARSGEFQAARAAAAAAGVTAKWIPVKPSEEQQGADA